MENTFQFFGSFCARPSKIWPVLVAFVIFPSPAITQSCPSGWYTFMRSCYLFHGDAPKTYQDARELCESKGSALVSVTSRPEHGFISRWLQENDPLERQWYTSGIREGSHSSNDVSPKFSWRGTGDVINPDSPQFWEPVHDLNNSTSGVIVYSHGDGGYMWNIQQPTARLAFICEVPESEVYRVTDAYRDFDYGLMKVDLAKLERGPHFIVQPHSIVVVGNAQVAAELECVASGNPHPVYSWYKGEQLEFPLTPESGRYTITNGKLIISNPTEQEDNGRYQCVAENKFGIIRSDVVHMSFGYLGEFSNVPDAPVNAKAYEGAKIDCSKVAYKPAVEYQWYKSKTAKFVRTQFQKYMFISNYGRLYFSEVTRADEGQYRCIATLTGVTRYTIGGQSVSRTSLPIQLHVYDQAPIADWGPVIQDEFIAVFPALPLAGHDIRLECFAYGTSTSEFRYRWVREGRDLPSNAVLSDHNRILVLRKAKLDDQGIYTCTVTRDASSDQKSLDFKLGAKPYFLTPIQNQHADIGSPLTWRCDARANPTPTFQWMKNGQPVVTDPKRFVKVNNNVLTISKLDPTLHNGMYQCSVSNVHGTTLSEGQLRVLEIAPNFYKFPMQPSTRAPLLGNVTLPCKPEGAPASKITWYKNGVELNIVDSGIYSMTPGGRLKMTSVQGGDGGRYTCKAENFLGVAENTTELYIVEGTHITEAPENKKAVVNTTVFFECSASHAPGADMIFRWRFNGLLIDFRLNPEFEAVHAGPGGVSGLYIKHVNHRHTGWFECVAITTINSDIKGAYLEVLGPPAEPAGLYVDVHSVSSSSLLLKWTRGNKRGSDITHYIIEGNNSEDKKNDREWEVVVAGVPASEARLELFEDLLATEVTGLNPGCSYRFRVIAVNQYGLGPPSLPSKYVTTLTAAPIVAPTNVGGGDGKVGELHMTWTPLTRVQHGAPGIGYKLYWRRHLDKPGALWEKHIINGSASTYVAFVGEENYFLEYEFKLQAFNMRGDGPNTTQVIIMSAEDLPAGVPTNVEADGYNGTAMLVWWDPVPDTREAARGKILGYQINYWHESEVATDNKLFIRHAGQIDTGIVIGLVSDNFYTFTVQVYNSAGLGQISEFFYQETLHAPAMHYPQEVRINSAGRGEVDVWWRGVGIKQPERTIDGYIIYVVDFPMVKIYYWPAYEHYRSATEYYSEGRRVYRARIKVEPGIVYALRVGAFGAGGHGRKSPTTYFAVEGRNVVIDYQLMQVVEAFLSSSTALSSSFVATLTVSLLVLLAFKS